MTITKPRTFRRRRGNGRRRGPRREHLRTEAEQLDYEMELHRAQREGREQEFLAEERAKLRARRATQLDDEMDAYFKQRDDAVASAKDTPEDADAKPAEKTNGDVNTQDAVAPADDAQPDAQPHPAETTAS